MADTLGLLDDIDQRLDQLLAGDPLDDPDHITADALVATMGLATKLEALCARLADRVDISGVWRDDGSRSAAAWLGRRSGRRRRDCTTALRRGQQLDALPLLAAAFAAGDLSGWHVDQICRLYKHWPGQVAKDQENLVRWATELDCDGFTQVLAYWRQHVDPDGTEHDALGRYRRRRLNLSDGIDGCGLLDVAFEPIGWATFKEALRRIEHELWEHDWADARERLGDDAGPNDLTRTDPQRRYDALIELATRATVAPTDGRRPRPLITVHVDHDTLAGRISQLSTGIVITPGEILPLLTDCDIERAVFDGPSRIIDLGRRQRLFVGGTRRAIEIVHPTCAHPGCRTPSEQCDIDHDQPWEQGGSTSQHNGTPRCPQHHRHRHRRDRDRRSARDDDPDDDA